MTLPVSQASFPELYEQHLVPPLFRPFAEDIVQDLEIARGNDVLDIACGTGIVARLAKKRTGEGNVVGVDSNPQMLDVARRSDPSVDWRQGDATNLPVDDTEKFDVVTCQQGIQFFPDRPAAMREMHRVLKGNGRLGVSAWRSDTEFPFLLELRKVAERHVGPIADRRHSLGDAAELENLLSDAGFRDVRSRAISHTIHFADAKLWTRLNAMALVGMSAKSKELSPDERSRVTETVIADSSEVLARFCDRADGVDFPIAANVVVARR